jgi:hypothetical protein
MLSPLDGSPTSVIQNADSVLWKQQVHRQKVEEPLNRRMEYGTYIVL